MTRPTRKINRFYMFLCCIVAISLIGFVTVNLYAQNDKKKMESRKTKLEKEILEMNRQLEQTKMNKSANLNQLVLINKKIDKREELISEIEQEVGNIDNQVKNLNDTIYRITMNLRNLKEEYARIIYSTYRNRSAYNRLMFLFSSHNFNQAYKRLKYLQQYTEYRKSQVISINETQNILAAKKLEFEKRKSSKLILKHSQEEERNSLADEKSQKDEKIKNLTSQEKTLLIRLRNNEIALNKLQAAIEKIVAAEIKKATEEKARKAAAEAAQRASAKREADRKALARSSSGAKSSAPVAKAEALPVVNAAPDRSNSMSASAEDVALSGSFAGNKGRLPSPVDKGSVISSFGEHAHAEYQNIKIKNNGIDMTSVPGAQAKVIFDGEVSSVIFITNLNYVVIVRHGDYLTVYSNLESVTVKKGDKVKTHQSLGTVTTAQGESKSRLHFELWQGTIVQNPASWLNI